LNGWNIGGVCNIVTSPVHSDSYVAYISNHGFDNWIQQDLTLPGDQDYHLEAWVYPSIVGNLGEFLYPFSCVSLNFLDPSSKVSLNVRYAWSWYEAGANVSQGVAFLLDFKASQWNLLSRDVSMDARSYFINVNFSKLTLHDIVWEYHYSEVDPGAFYLDDVSLTGPVAQQTTVPLPIIMVSIAIFLVAIAASGTMILLTVEKSHQKQYLKRRS
jgi:hypothetical protein